MNNISIIGRLVRDPELRTTTTGKNVANITVAVDKRFKGDGATADFFRVTAWGQSADYLNNYASKGRLVGITGRMECRQYNDKEGGKRETWELVAETVSLLDRPKDDQQAKPAQASAEEYDPFAED